MTLSPIEVDRFGGLNISADPSELGWQGAVDVLNVDFSAAGRVRTRSGYTAQFTPTSPATLYRSGSGAYLVGDTGSNLRAYNTSGTLLATQANFYGSQLDAVTWYSPTASKVYAVQYQGAAGMVEWDGAATFTSSALLGAVSVAVTPWDNRLVRGATTTNLSRVFFSDAGAPTTFGANNYVDLVPGGGVLTSVRSWRDLLVAFKADRFFTFYGTTTDSSGNPIFNYRTVDTGGIGCASVNAAVAGREGIYFAARDGIYVTDGGQPRKVSAALDPIFQGEFPSLFAGVTSTTQMSGPRLTYSGGRLFVATSGDSSVRITFVYWPDRNEWSLYSIAAKDIVPDGGDTGVYFVDATKLHYHAFAPAVTTDDGAAITSRYRSGFSDLGTSDKKRIHSWRLQGSGAPTFKVSTDFGTLETGAAVTLGTSPAVAAATRRYAPSGRQFSWQLGGTTAWSVNSVVANVAGKRDTGDN